MPGDSVSRLDRHPRLVHVALVTASRSRQWVLGWALSFAACACQSSTAPGASTSHPALSALPSTPAGAGSTTSSEFVSTNDGESPANGSEVNTRDTAAATTECAACASDARSSGGGSQGSSASVATTAPPTGGASESAAPSSASTELSDGVESATSNGDFCEVGRSGGERAAPLTLSGNTFAHDPTMIKVEQTYYRFWTGDFVPSAKSSDLRQWGSAPTAYPNVYPAWVDEWRGEHPGNTFNFPWAPDVSYFGGKYHLYTSFSAFFGRNSSCITHSSTSDIASGQWEDHGPVICSEGDDPFNAIDADVGLDAEGNPWLAFGSFWDGIFAFPLDAQGNRVGTDLTRLAWAREIEAPVLFYRCGYYYLFVSHGLCCPGEGRSVDDLSYRVVVGRSRDILGPYVDRDGAALLDGGGTLVVEGDGATYAAAGHSDVMVDGEQVYHLYHAYRRRDAGAELRIVEMPFDAEGWPVGGAP